MGEGGFSLEDSPGKPTEFANSRLGVYVEQT